MADTIHRETADQMTGAEIAAYSAAGGWLCDMDDFVKGRSRKAVAVRVAEVNPTHGEHAHVVRVAADPDGMAWYAAAHHS